ncbi:MAG TPA: hypothetical protein GX700_09455 [Paracoccus sp.]|nr:hypothetical protein [Paracoccus sp. (in: a-proteobacteria)]
MQELSSGAMPVSICATAGLTRHEGLVLIDARGASQGDAVQPLLRRLLSPRARIEGVDCRLNDPALIEAAGAARAFVMLLPPLGNLGNPFYSVHPRRNDRFLAARPKLKALFPEVDFTEFDFTGHMLSTLATTCPHRFAELRRLLRHVWRIRLEGLLAHLPGNGVLVQIPGPGWLAVPAGDLANPARPVVTTDGVGPKTALPRLQTALESALHILHA